MIHRRRTLHDDPVNLNDRGMGQSPLGQRSQSGHGDGAFRVAEWAWAWASEWVWVSEWASESAWVSESESAWASESASALEWASESASEWAWGVGVGDVVVLATRSLTSRVPLGDPRPVCVLAVAPVPVFPPGLEPLPFPLPHPHPRILAAARVMSNGKRRRCGSRWRRVNRSPARSGWRRSGSRDRPRNGPGRRSPRSRPRPALPGSSRRRPATSLAESVCPRSSVRPMAASRRPRPRYWDRPRRRRRECSAGRSSGPSPGRPAPTRTGYTRRRCWTRRFRTHTLPVLLRFSVVPPTARTSGEAAG